MLSSVVTCWQSSSQLWSSVDFSLGRHSTLPFFFLCSEHLLKHPAFCSCCGCCFLFLLKCSSLYSFLGNEKGKLMQFHAALRTKCFQEVHVIRARCGWLCTLCDKNLYEKRACSKVSTPPCPTLLILHMIKLSCAFFLVFVSFRGKNAVMSAWFTY